MINATTDRKPKVSIVTVCYNSSQTIDRSIRSVANQTYPLIEHIVVDGGSTDGTVEILKYSQSPILSYISEADEGIYDAMNKGARVATGDIIAFLNSDDFYVDNNVVADIVEAFSNVDVDFVCGNVEIFNPTTKKTIRSYRSKHFTIERLKIGWMPPHPATFIRKSCFEACQGFNTKYKIAGDFDFTLRAFLEHKAKMSVIDRTLTLMQAGGVSGRGWRSRYLLNKEINFALVDNGLPATSFWGARRYFGKFMMQRKIIPSVD